MTERTGNQGRRHEVGPLVSSYLPTRLSRAAERGGTITFLSGDGPGEPVGWAVLHEEAKAMAVALARRGVGPGAHVALLGPTSRPFVTAIQAVWLAGATVVVLPLPMRMNSLDDFVTQTRIGVRAADTSLVVADPMLAGFIQPEPGDPPVVLLPDLTGDASDPWAWEAPKEDPQALGILQFTSGSTADPKGVMLPHATICANLDAIAEAAALDPAEDVLCSWLPLYHDMGLIGLLTLGMTSGTDLALASPQDFLAAPGRWMQWMSDHRASATAGPNFSYALAARALRRLAPGTLDLSHLRVALNGAEAVDPKAVADFVAAGAPQGLNAGAVFPAFGMAESTLAVTFPPSGRGLRTDPIDRHVLETSAYAAPADPEAEGTRHLVLLGRPVPGLEIRIVDPISGAVRAEREVGELEIRGTSITTGYYRRPDATEAAFHDGWLRSGDLGYLVDGELAICGRIKDLIIVGGRNVYPEDVERAAASVEGVRAGNVIAFAVDGRRGKEALVVVAESKDPDLESVRAAVAGRVREVVGLPPEEVVLVEPGTLPKTSSGKLQRSLCRSRYLSAALSSR
ncbi:MAG TPA: fatty acyl-AMP ligase [Acidimicrobiia bacterium]|jgi:fatty-acyl-CoA synthase|nr:fatty acyl-AMP ligase [Acidimicrobiia bacterium]